MKNPLDFKEVIKTINIINKAIYGVPYIDEAEEEPADDKYANLKAEDDVFEQKVEE